MEKEESIKYAVRAFSYLMQKTAYPAFSFPGGAVALRKVADVVQSFGGNPGEERITDFCVCQIYAASGFNGDYWRRKWKVCHSFGKKAMERFRQNNFRKKYFEDRWLQQYGLSRNTVSAICRERKGHPLSKFIFLEYEENTKRRMQGTEVGLYVCLVSTLLWTPFSPVCQNCNHREKCREMTAQKYPELLRIRVEAYSNE